MELYQTLESILFYKGEPMTIGELARMTGAQPEEVTSALETLSTTLTEHSGLALIRTGDTLALGTRREAHATLESLKKEELSRELSKASLETLTIILYTDGVTRSEIDFIRGVNSSFILRNLSVRGLIEKSDAKEGRRNAYHPTLDTLAYMGVTRREELPDFDNLHTKFMTELQAALATDTL